MAFADLKNDLVFRRIFGTHPHILCALLDDLLERPSDQAIVSVEHLPSRPLPLAEWAKLSVLDVRCRDRAGATFVVEIQLIHHPGFVNRVVYDACNAYAGQIEIREGYAKLTDLVAVSICDFEIWPNAWQDEHGLPRVPMLSRWSMTEQTSKNRGLPQVQYAFLELPKLVHRGTLRAQSADLWAWLFAHAPELTDVPADLPAGPYRDALLLADKAKFTREELQAYERVRGEIRQVVEVASARFAEGKAEGRAEGKLEGKAEAVFAVLAARGLSVSADVRAHIASCRDPMTLSRWIVAAATARSGDEIVTPPPDPDTAATIPRMKARPSRPGS